jgi:hypothetical protein
VPSLAYPWPEGLAGLAELAGSSVDLAAVRQRRLLLFVGDQDVTTEFLEVNEAVNQFGPTRLERARSLHTHWRAADIPHELVVIPGMDHVGFTSHQARRVLGEFLVDR